MAGSRRSTSSSSANRRICALMILVAGLIAIAVLAVPVLFLEDSSDSSAQNSRRRSRVASATVAEDGTDDVEPRGEGQQPPPLLHVSTARREEDVNSRYRVIHGEHSHLFPTPPKRQYACPYNPFAGEKERKFPCTSRVPKWSANISEFGEWPSAEKQRKKELLEETKRYCKTATKSSGGGGGTGNRLSHVDVVGFEGESGRWNRFWVVTKTLAGTPRCVGGDQLDLQLESPIAKVVADRVIDIGSGIYEVTVFIRKRGKYTLCVDKLMTELPDELNYVLTEEMMSGRTNLSSFIDAPPPFPERQCFPRGFPLEATCFEAAGDYTFGVDVLPLPVPCPEATDPDRFRIGSWIKVGHCDADHCTGPSEVISVDGWVWVSDLCVVHFYTDEQLKQVYDGKWVVAWGPSTLKQPVVNLIEERLAQPIHSGVFQRYVPFIDWAKVPFLNRPDFFSYRNFDMVMNGPQKQQQQQQAANASLSKLKGSRFSMMWGGCKDTRTWLEKCYDSVGIRSWDRINATIGAMQRDQHSRALFPPSTTLTSEDSDAHQDSDHQVHEPDVVLLDQYKWRFPLWDEATFLGELQEAMRKVVRRFAAHPTDKKKKGAAGSSSSIVEGASGDDNTMLTKKNKKDASNSAAVVEGDSDGSSTTAGGAAGGSSKTKKPLNGYARIIFNGPVAFANAPSHRPCVTPPLFPRARHIGWAMEDLLTSPEFSDDLLFISRTALQHPLHFGDEYVHQRVHYGATVGNCILNYPLQTCVRKTLGDDMLNVLWYNSMPHAPPPPPPVHPSAASASPTSESAGHSSDSRKKAALPPWEAWVRRHINNNDEPVENFWGKQRSPFGERKVRRIREIRRMRD